MFNSFPGPVYTHNKVVYIRLESQRRLKQEEQLLESLKNIVKEMNNRNNLTSNVLNVTYEVIEFSPADAVALDLLLSIGSTSFKFHSACTLMSI